MLEKISEKYPELRRKLVGPLVVRVNPNYVTLLALIAALLAGIYFYLGYLLIGAVLVFINGFLDVLDGQIAKQYGPSKRGDFLDHTFDRLADVAILLGITLSGYVPEFFGFMTIIAVLLVSYLGTAAQAVSEKRMYGGGLSRADRIIILTVAPILSLYYAPALLYSIYLIFFVSSLTFVMRFFKIYITI